MDLLFTERGRYFLVYGVLSTGFAALAMYDVMSNYCNFYTVGLGLSQEGTIIILGNFAVLISLILGKIIQVAIFGELRLLETEHIYERSWFTVINSLMAIAMFRNENNLLILVLVLGLLFMKVFHWILADRLDYIIQNSKSVQSALMHRCTFSLLFFLYIDHKIVMSCIDQSFIHSGDLFVMFGLDFSMVYLNLLEVTSKFVLNLIELRYLQVNTEEDSWEFKSWISKIIDITISIIRVSGIVFVFIGLINAYKLPINFPGDIYMAVIKLIRQVKEFYYFVKSLRELENNLSDPTQEDLDRDEVCIICRYDMDIDPSRSKSHRSTPKKLQCGHVLHFGCLKAWLSRSKHCPTCRSDVFKKNTNTFANGAAGGHVAPNANDANVNMNNMNNNNNLNDNDNENWNANDNNNDIAHDNIPIHPIPQPQNLYSIRLPHNAFTPRDWTVVPLRRTDDPDKYEIKFDHDHSGTLEVIRNQDSHN